MPLQGEPQNINLWVKSIASAIEPTKINDVLVMLENNSRENQGENWGSARGTNF
ncbi:hypothetical protein QUB75_05955 [Microcoleus sp. K1-B6]|uniref:hypothetical protein n=1 Tax=unclassified Microcoleus TaxID=2642155 RepID=UPI002FD30695